MPIVPRKFVQLNDQSDKEPRAIEAFYNVSAFVVLGEPGAGKSTSFERAAATEPNGVYIRARDFLALDPGRWQGKTLYIDGLDELRGKTSDGASVLDEIRSRVTGEYTH